MADKREMPLKARDKVAQCFQRNERDEKQGGLIWHAPGQLPRGTVPRSSGIISESHFITLVPTQIVFTPVVNPEYHTELPILDRLQRERDSLGNKTAIWQEYPMIEPFTSTRDGLALLIQNILLRIENRTNMQVGDQACQC